MQLKGGKGTFNQLQLTLPEEVTGRDDAPVAMLAIDAIRVKPRIEDFMDNVFRPLLGDMVIAESKDDGACRASTYEEPVKVEWLCAEE